MTAMKIQEVKILDQLLLVDLSGIHLWTAKKKLDEKLLGGKLPPEKLATVGTMRIIDHEHLKPFEQVKRKAIKVMEENGVRFLGGYAIPKDRIQDVADQLEALKSQFYNLKNNFLLNYDGYVHAWIDSWSDNPEWRDALRAAIVPKAKVSAGMAFGYAACRVSPDGDQRLAETLGSEVRGLSDQLYAEVAETAEKLLDSGLAQRGQVSQTTINTVRKICNKLGGLMFLSRDVAVLTQHIEDVLAKLPHSGVVTGSEYNQVVTLVSSLSHEDSIRRLVKHLNIAQGDAPEAEPQEMFSVAAASVEQAQPELHVDPTPELPVTPELALEPVVPAQEPSLLGWLEAECSVQDAQDLPADAETLDEEQFVTLGELIEREKQLQAEPEAAPAAESEEKPEPEEQIASFWF